jgi:transcriptional regulator of stress and heat shock response
MRNLADYIEAFILGKLEREREEIVVLKRNEVAEAMECAPSQVTYVLGTRFTVERGFQVESRRGAGGFVRIARVPIETLLCEDVARNLDAETSPQELTVMLRRLQRQDLLTAREVELIRSFFTLLYPEVEEQTRVRLMRSLLLRLANLS